MTEVILTTSIILLYEFYTLNSMIFRDLWPHIFIPGHHLYPFLSKANIHMGKILGAPFAVPSLIRTALGMPLS